jgi:hypothetical protein
VKFREYWDAELRASVYLNEFLTKNTGWLKDLKEAIYAAGLATVNQGLYAQLQAHKGEQLRRVIEVSDEREERFLEIVDQNDGEGVIKYFLGMLMIDAAHDPATYQLIRVARRVGEVVGMCLKEEYHEARPSQVCPVIVPLLGPPVTPSFPAGHALQSHLIARCLREAKRLPHQPDMLDKLARRIAQNRVIAGLHYPLDNEAGKAAAERCFTLLNAQGSQFAKLLIEAQKEAEQVPEVPEVREREV